MDEYTRRLVAPVWEALDRYQQSIGGLTEIQASASAAAGALDGAQAELRDCLLAFDPELEAAQFARPEAEQAVVDQLRERLERAAGAR